MATISDIFDRRLEYGRGHTGRIRVGTNSFAARVSATRTNLTVYRRTDRCGSAVRSSTQDEHYHVVYTMQGSADGLVKLNGEAHIVEEGAGVLLAPGESAGFEATGSDLELLHMVTPRPPAAVEDGLPGGPGYFFNRQTLRALSDASGGRVRRFCAESSVELLDGSRLTPTNAIQAGEMHYIEGRFIAVSPPRRHRRQPRRSRARLYDVQGSRPGRSGGDFTGNRTGYAVLFPTGRAASTPRPWRLARLLRDSGLAKFQDDRNERGAAGFTVVLRTGNAGCRSCGVEPELNVQACPWHGFISPGPQCTRWPRASRCGVNLRKLSARRAPCNSQRRRPYSEPPPPPWLPPKARSLG